MGIPVSFPTGLFSSPSPPYPSLQTKRSAFRSILFGLCFYHSLLLGRKKFGVGIGTGSGSGLGFCRGYSFNMGDLTTCGDVLFNYLEAYEQVIGHTLVTPWLLKAVQGSKEAASQYQEPSAVSLLLLTKRPIQLFSSLLQIPWPDLRYMFGEVFYGGHITDSMDRRCCTTYLDVLIRPEILPKGSLDAPEAWTQPELELAPGFKCVLSCACWAGCALCMLG